MHTSKPMKLITFLLLAVLLMTAGQHVFAQSASPVPVGVMAERAVQPNTRVEIPVEIQNVNGLYALDIAFTFDPTVMAAEDADSSQPGIQMALGSFLDPGMVLYNTVDNQKGTAHFVMTQVNPSEPKSGSGILLVIYFKTLKAGDTALTFTNLQLSSRDGLEIPVTKMESPIHIQTDAPVVESTSIPVQAPESLIQIPTEIPTPTPTVTPYPTPMPTAQGDAKNVVGNEVQPSGQSSSVSSFSFWWIAGFLLVLVIGAAVYLFSSRKKNG